MCSHRTDYHCSAKVCIANIKWTLWPDTEKRVNHYTSLQTQRWLEKLWWSRYRGCWQILAESKEEGKQADTCVLTEGQEEVAVRRRSHQIWRCLQKYMGGAITGNLREAVFRGWLTRCHGPAPRRPNTLAWGGSLKEWGERWRGMRSRNAFNEEINYLRFQDKDSGRQTSKNQASI